MSFARWFLDVDIKACHKCEGLNIKGITENAPGYGNIASPIMIIGQSLCTQCMSTQIPFTGGSGIILDKAFAKAGVKKSDLFITNLVHCHPPDNRPSKISEIINCREFLQKEIDLVNPILIIGLGREVHNEINTNASKQVCYRHLNGKYKGRFMCFIDHPAYIYRNGINSKMCHDYIDFLVDLMKRFI